MLNFVQLVAAFVVVFVAVYANKDSDSNDSGVMISRVTSGEPALIGSSDLAVGADGRLNARGKTGKIETQSPALKTQTTVFTTDMELAGASENTHQRPWARILSILSRDCRVATCLCRK